MPNASTKPSTTSRIHRMLFASVYPLYLQKVERKGRTREELDEVIRWLTGYTDAGLARQRDRKVDFETFFVEAPRVHPKASLVTGVVCGVRVEAIEDDVERKVRILDKLVDELAKGRAMDKILRT